MALKLLRNVALDADAIGAQASTICEPTVAAHGRELFVTGNWFAARSADDGRAWRALSPFARFAPAAGGFCCDQVALFVPALQVWVWLLQYTPGDDGENLLRLAVSSRPDFADAHHWDLVPSRVDARWSGDWFDYPDMTVTDGHLFVSVNLFRGQTWRRAAVLRFPLQPLARGAALGYRCWSTEAVGSIRLCRGPGAVQFMGSHRGGATLRVLRWCDDSAAVTWQDVAVSPWSDGPFTAPGPGGAEWLARLDGRITGAWCGAGSIGFMWSANRDERHPWPFVRAVRLRASDLERVDEPDLWSRASAWAYPAAAANARGEVGFTACYGGGRRHPSHVVGVWADGGWRTRVAATSTHGPSGGAWGDYLGIAPAHPGGEHWVAAGYTLRGGASRRRVQPRVVRFRA